MRLDSMRGALSPSLGRPEMGGSGSPAPTTTRPDGLDGGVPRPVVEGPGGSEGGTIVEFGLAALGGSVVPDAPADRYGG